MCFNPLTRPPPLASLRQGRGTSSLPFTIAHRHDRKGARRWRAKGWGEREARRINASTSSWLLPCHELEDPWSRMLHMQTSIADGFNDTHRSLPPHRFFTTALSLPSKLCDLFDPGLSRLQGHVAAVSRRCCVVALRPLRRRGDRRRRNTWSTNGLADAPCNDAGWQMDQCSSSLHVAIVLPRRTWSSAGWGGELADPAPADPPRVTERGWPPRESIVVDLLSFSLPCCLRPRFDVDGDHGILRPGRRNSSLGGRRRMARVQQRSLVRRQLPGAHVCTLYRRQRLW